MESNFEKLRAIETERNDLLNKLQKIEEKKASVSHEVYLKVKKDYEIKLGKLDEILAENKELVKTEMSKIKTELSELLQKQKETKLYLEELELRYSIGEYNEDDYNRLAKEANENMSVIQKKVNQLQDRIKWCEGVLGAEKTEEVLVTGEPEEVEAKVEVGEKAEELTIDEHILETKLPEEVKKLDELLVETNALLEETEKKEEVKPEKKKEEGIACPKCGFINPPDSWYCEKCGAEILTIN